MNAASVQQYLEGAEFPMTRDELIDHAQTQGASGEIVSALENLPDREFSSQSELMTHMNSTTAAKESEDEGM